MEVVGCISSNPLFFIHNPFSSSFRIDYMYKLELLVIIVDRSLNIEIHFAGCYHVSPSPACPALPGAPRFPARLRTISLQIGLQRLLLGGFAKMVSELIWSSFRWGRNRQALSVRTIHMAGDRHSPGAQASQINRRDLRTCMYMINRSLDCSLSEQNHIRQV